MPTVLLARIASSLCLLALLVSPAVADDAWWTAAPSEETGLLDALVGPSQHANWSLAKYSGWKSWPMSIVRDERLGRDVVHHADGRATMLTGTTRFEGAYEIAARVRFTKSARGQLYRIQAVFAKDPADPDDKGIVVTLTPQPQHRRIFVNIQDGAQRTTDQLVTRPYANILPTWDTTLRRSLERDAHRFVDVTDKWTHLRFVASPGEITLYLDDRAVYRKTGDDVDGAGTASFSFGPGNRLDRLVTRRVDAPLPRFTPITLDAIATDRTLVDGAGVRASSLPLGKTVTVEGVPFQFVDPANSGGGDHVDVGRSLLREANTMGYMPLSALGPRIGSSLMLDPARPRLRIPFARYDALYMICGFDGDTPSVPTVTASFYRPKAGFFKSFSVDVPSVRGADNEDAVTPLPITLDDGGSAQLYLVKMPLSPAALGSFADMATVELEFTKRIAQFRSYPDPIFYGWHGAGLPSGVHVYAATLSKPAVDMVVAPKVFGDVWTQPDKPEYVVTVRGREPRAVTGKLTIETLSYDGQEKTHQARSFLARALGQAPNAIPVTINVKKRGYHDATFTLEYGGVKWTEHRSFVVLAPDDRPKRFERGKGPMFGYWSYHGGHYTPPAEEHIRLMVKAGARGSISNTQKNEATAALREQVNFQAATNAFTVAPQRWAPTSRSIRKRSRSSARPLPSATRSWKRLERSMHRSSPSRTSRAMPRPATCPSIGATRLTN